MNLTVRLTALTFVFFLFAFLLSAQVRTNGVISGKIIDAATKLPVEYANVVLLDSLTHSMAGGIVTDSTGLFRLQNVRPGIYIVEYSFIGYRKQRTPPVFISVKKLKADLGQLMLYSSAVNMDEVTITAEKNLMINKIDRKVFNVQKDISSQTGTAIDMLQTIPSVSVDVDGNISLRGSQNVTVLINGRPSVMSGSANLDQMPASLIERIEVITNPSAKYRPDGTGGIINIILKKEKKAGTNGFLGLNAGLHDRFNANLQVNYNTGKTNLFGSYGFRQDYRKRSGSLTSQTIDTALNKSTYLWQNSKGTSLMKSHLVRLGVDWNISKKDMGGISGSCNFRSMDREDHTTNLYENDSLQPYSQFLRSLDGIENETGTGVKAYYEHTFNRESEHQLKIEFDYQHDLEKSHDNWTNDYQVPLYPQGQDHTDGNNLDQGINFTLNYSRPLWKNASVETGYEANIDLTDQQQDVTHWDPDNGQWFTDTVASTRFIASQPVFAVYGILSYSWKKLRMMGGLRAEEALTRLEFQSLNTTTKNDYFALYPTVHLGLESGKNEWQLNYSRRVNRPRSDDMNPVPEYRDPRNIFKGNPNLKPEDIHSFELGYAIQGRELSFVPTLFYRYKVHGFTRVTTSLNDTVLITTMENLASDQSAGLDLSGSWQIGKIANINFSASGFYNEIDASNIGYSSSKSAFSWNAKINASVSITKTTMIQVNGQYRSEALTPQGYRLPSWGVNLGFRQDFWKKRISLVATVSDLFDSQAWKTSVSTPILVQESVRRRDARVIFAGVVVSLGKKSKKNKEPRFEFDNGTE
jgi:outer membrane receptor protein involved in Fe transport